jgi:3-hydroxyacyl-[acyl-carrier-protein] dehydratase
MPQELFFDPARYDINKPLMDKAEIRQVNQQRFEMEQLDGVLFHDLERKLIGGFLRLPGDAWWSRGHFPGHPILPGVLALEAGGQLCSIYFHHLVPGHRMGLAKIGEGRFFRTIEPPGILYLGGRLVSQRSRFAQFEIQGFQDGEVTFEAMFTGASI